MELLFNTGIIDTSDLEKSPNRWSLPDKQAFIDTSDLEKSLNGWSFPAKQAKQTLSPSATIKKKLPQRGS